MKPCSLQKRLKCEASMLKDLVETSSILYILPHVLHSSTAANSNTGLQIGVFEEQ